MLINTDFSEIKKYCTQFIQLCLVYRAYVVQWHNTLSVSSITPIIISHKIFMSTQNNMQIQDLLFRVPTW